MELKYIVYITINLCNGKFYIGVHKTNPNVFDGYIGNGIYRENQAKKDTPFQKAVRKYGYNNFKRTTLKIFPDTKKGEQQAYALEQELVTETLLKSKSSYNVALGGYGGFHTVKTQKIYQYSISGKYLNTFNSLEEAAKSLNPKNLKAAIKAINNNCLEKTSSSYGYVWNYSNCFKNPKSKGQKIAQYTLSGKFLRTFDSITEAENLLGLTSIFQAIKKEYSCGNSQWRYYTDNNDIPPLTNTFTKQKVVPIKVISNSGKECRFNSIADCVKVLKNLSITQINRVLKGKIKTHKGYKFMYDTED